MALRVNKEKLVPSGSGAIDSITLSSVDMKENSLLLFCSLVNRTAAISGVGSFLLHLYIILCQHAGWVDNSVLTTMAIGASHGYLVVFGIMIVLTERESQYFFRYFVSYMHNLYE